MERAGKEQEREHPLHQHVLEFQLGEQPAHRAAQAQAGEQRLDRDQPEGGDGARDRQADGMGQTQNAMIQIAKRGGRHDQDRRDVEEAEPARLVMHDRSVRFSRQTQLSLASIQK